MALVHCFGPVSSSERANANVTIRPLARAEGIYGMSADVGGMQADLVRLLAGVLGIPEDVA